MEERRQVSDLDIWKDSGVTVEQEDVGKRDFSFSCSGRVEIVVSSVLDLGSIGCL